MSTTIFAALHDDLCKSGLGHSSTIVRAQVTFDVIDALGEARVEFSFDMLLRSTAERHDLAVFTTDPDFDRYATVLPIRRHEARSGALDPIWETTRRPRICLFSAPLDVSSGSTG
jgi:hypothetical protein